MTKKRSTYFSIIQKDTFDIVTGSNWRILFNYHYSTFRSRSRLLFDMVIFSQKEQEKRNQ